MRVDVVSLFPEFVAQTVALGVTGRAIERGLLQVRTWNPRDYAQGSYRKVDERPFGGGPGMVMMLEPLERLLAAVRESGAPSDAARVVYLSPQGARLTQRKVEAMAGAAGLILFCGRYEGVDQRFIDHVVDEELSLGDFVLSGGELAAAAVIDSIARLTDGALGNPQSAARDSFSDGLLDHPHYSRPETHRLGAVPGPLLSGDHARIARWRRQQQLGVTWLKRPDLLAAMTLSEADRDLLTDFRHTWRLRRRALTDSA